MALNDDLLAEYAQAGANFRDGFGTILSIIKSFVTINGLLLAGFGLTYRFLDGSLQTAVSLAICIIGVAASFITWIIHRRMTIYFRSWVERARQIEAGTEMRLYTFTSEIERSSRKNPLQTYAIMNITYLFVGLTWFLVLLFFSFSSGHVPETGAS